MPDANLTTAEAMAAYHHADDVIRTCVDDDELDEASNRQHAFEACPAEFTQAQREVAHGIILHAYERSIGRA